MPLPAFRVCTYNVQRFTPRTAGGPPSFLAIAAALAALEPRPALVCLNEVDVSKEPEALNTLAKHLGRAGGGGGPAHVAFFGHVRGRYGNAVLSRYPIVGRKEVHLRGGTEVSFAPGTLKLNGEVAQPGDLHRIARGLLVVDVQLVEGGLPLRLGCTHLDHMHIAERRTQLAHVVETLRDDEESAAGLLLVGDLNALTRSDFDDAAWRSLEERAAARGWEGPGYGDLDLLGEAGFVDAAHHSEKQLTAHTQEPMYRIDYCFHRVRGLGVPRTQVLPLTFSDHFPLLVDFSGARDPRHDASSL